MSTDGTEVSRSTATVDVDIMFDNSLFGEIAEIDFENGYTYKGFWLLVHLIVAAATQLRAAHPDVPNIKVVRVRCGSEAYRMLTSTSINRDLVQEQAPNDEEIATPV